MVKIPEKRFFSVFRLMLKNSIDKPEKAYSRTEKNERL